MTLEADITYQGVRLFITLFEDWPAGQSALSA